MFNTLVAFPLQIACQIILPANLSYGNIDTVIDPSVLQITTALSPSVPTTILPGGYTVFPDVGVAYKFHANEVTWETARQLCIAEGARLSIVDSFKKIEYIMGIKDRRYGTWTGIRKQDDNDQWTNFETGQPVDFIPWRPNAFADTGLCVANRHDTLGVSPWNCNGLVPTICEIPIFKNEENKAYITQGPPDRKVPN